MQAYVSRLTTLMIIQFFLLPSSNDAKLTECTKVGILEKKDGKCWFILPTGDMNVPVKVNGGYLRPEDCGKYLTGMYKKGLVAWTGFTKSTTKNKIKPRRIYCGSDSNECNNQDFHVKELFNKCYDESDEAKLTIWIENMKPRFFGLANCENGQSSGEYSVYTDFNNFYTDIPDMPDKLVLSSFFYSHPARAPNRVFLLMTSGIGDDIAPKILTIDL